ncbi:MAG: GxxExxY protein [Rhodanobacteraceae bacterium]
MNENTSRRVIGCAVRVSKELGHGFLEKVYEQALAMELAEDGIRFERQRLLPVRYRGRVISEYCCDFIVNDELLLELKAVSRLTPIHEAQLMNYLKATGVTVGLLLNFGRPKLGIKRIVNNYDDGSAI